jgi:hypothetical protein
LALAAVLALAFYIRRDMNLMPGPASLGMPDVSVENLDFRRATGGRNWHIRAAKAEHDSGMIRAFEIEVDVSDVSSDRSMSLRAQSGEFAERDYSLDLRSLDGTLFQDGRSMDVLAPQANYERSLDVWRFEQGVELWDDKSYINGGAASIAGDGVLSIRKGAYVSWTVE